MKKSLPGILCLLAMPCCILIFVELDTAYSMQSWSVITRPSAGACAYAASPGPNTHKILMKSCRIIVQMVFNCKRWKHLMCQTR